MVVFIYNQLFVNDLFCTFLHPKLRNLQICCLKLAGKRIGEAHDEPRHTCDSALPHKQFSSYITGINLMLLSH